jgi:flagellar hook-basal body complex protein FliE
MATPGLAANAYAQTARITDAAAGIRRAAVDITGGNADHGPNFTDVLKQALVSVRQAGEKSDDQARALATGSNKADIVDVVTAVAETETAVNTLVSVRDKVIAAYQSIMQMPI